MTYKILSAFDTAELARKVNTAIDDGWEPKGGVSVSAWHQAGMPQGEHWELYAQAMVLVGEPEAAKKRAPKPRELSQEECHRIEEAGRRSLERQP